MIQILEQSKKQQESNQEQPLLGGITGKGFMPGKSGNPNGRLPDTPEKKLAKKAMKKLVDEYKESLAGYLPEISPVLGEKAIKEKDLGAIKEINDIVVGKAPTSIEMKVRSKHEITEEEQEEIERLFGSRQSLPVQSKDIKIKDMKFTFITGEQGRVRYKRYTDDGEIEFRSDWFPNETAARAHAEEVEASEYTTNNTTMNEENVQAPVEDTEAPVAPEATPEATPEAPAEGSAEGSAEEVPGSVM